MRSITGGHDCHNQSDRPLPASLPNTAASAGRLHAEVDCQQQAVNLTSPERPGGSLTRPISPAEVGGSCGQSWETVALSKYATRLKRLLDIAVSLVVMPAALVVISICAVLIKLTSPGPVFYRQQRVGKDGRLFTFVKLRTMVPDAEKDTGPVWARKDDPRVTPVGRLLRRLHVDELPQLFNVLRGEMSLVGPRPERPEFVEQFKRQIALYDKRLLVRPGITGWAQVHRGSDSSLEDVAEKLRYDLYYIRHLSFSLDLRIILATIGVMLRGRSAH